MNKMMGAAVCACAVVTGCAEYKKPMTTQSIAQRAPQPEMSIIERAKAEQAALCGQRHMEREAGKLNETAVQKQARNEQCVELHKRDYVKQ